MAKPNSTTREIGVRYRAGADYEDATEKVMRRRGPEVRQRDVDAALKSVGGRGSKGAQAVNDLVGSGSTQSLRLQMKTGARLSGRATSAVGGRLADGSRRLATIARAGIRGMLSPAGIAEGVAGSIAKLSQEEGPRILHEAMESTRSIKMPRGSKPTRRKA